MQNLAGKAAPGLSTLGKLIGPGLRIANVARLIPAAAGLMANPMVGIPLAVGAGLLFGGKALMNRFGPAAQQNQAEQVTKMSASGFDTQDQLGELAAAYSGELTPAMEAAGYSVEEVRKRIDKMAKLRHRLHQGTGQGSAGAGQGLPAGRRVQQEPDE